MRALTIMVACALALVAEPSSVHAAAPDGRVVALEHQNLRPPGIVEIGAEEQRLP